MANIPRTYLQLCTLYNYETTSDWNVSIIMINCTCK